MNTPTDPEMTGMATEPAVVRCLGDIPKWRNLDSPLVIVDCSPSSQQSLLQGLLPTLHSDHTVVFNVGKLASLEFVDQVAEKGCRLAETNADLYFSTHRPVYLSGLTREVTESTVDDLRPTFPNLLPADSPQECALNDPAAVLGPVTLLLNLSRVEQMGPYRTSLHDATESVARVIDALDRERRALTTANGYRAHTLSELLGVTGSSAYQALQKSGFWNRHMSPDGVNHPHFCEEIPYSLAPWAQLALASEVPMPHLQSILTLAATALGQELTARRSYRAFTGRQSSPGLDEHLLSLGLSETVTAGTSGIKLTLTGIAVEVQMSSHENSQATPSPGGLAVGNIAESFEKLRRALEEKLGDEAAGETLE